MNNGKFVTLTFSEESLVELGEDTLSLHDALPICFPVTIGRTDRFEIAVEATNAISKATIAKGSEVTLETREVTDEE